MEKIVIPLSNGWHGFSAETLWGTKIDTNFYKIDSIPFFANNISCGDIVEAHLDKNDKRLKYTRTVSKGSNCTYRIVFADNIKSDDREKYIKLLKEFGEIEYFKEAILFAISVHKQKVDKLFKILMQLEDDGFIDFEEGDCVK